MIAERLRRARVDGLRVVPLANMHVTMRFFGEVSAQAAEDIAAATAVAAREFSPFTLRLGAPGVYPSPSRARVLWVGLTGDTQALLAARRQVDAALVAIGLRAERGKFSPHLTVARLSDRARPDARRRAVATLMAGPPPPAPFRVEGMTLYRSELSSSGANYSPLARIPLGESPVAARPVARR